MEIKTAYKISFLFLILLSLGALYFYKERMLFIDPAFIIFEIINNKTFIFSEHRYGAFITQLFPLAGTYLGLPLKYIMLLYSLSFYLFYMAVVYIAGFKLKQYKLAILFVFYLCFIVSDVYFWPNNEIHQSIGWMILFLSLYTSLREKDWKVGLMMHLGLIITLFLSIISHMLVVLPFTFLWLYDIIASKKIKSNIKFQSIYSFLILAIIGIRYWLSHSSWYDGAKLEGVKQISISSIFAAFQNEHSVSMLQLMVSKYFFLIIIFTIGVSTLLYLKKYLQLGLVLLFTISYYVLVTVTFSNPIKESNLFYFESQWMGWAIILSTPFLYETLKHIKQIKFVILIFVLIYLAKIPVLIPSISKFNNRVSQLESLVENAREQGFSKYYLYKTEIEQHFFLETWGIPVESMLLSNLENDKETITIKTIDKGFYISSALDSIYTAFKYLPNSKMNEQYFKVNDSSQYQPLKK